MMQDLGAEVHGIDMNDAFIEYAKQAYGIVIRKRPVEHPSWTAEHGGSFDVVTLRDVIEHVNQPLEILQASARLLKPGGLLLIDTPCRDAFFHRAGCLSYRLSLGRFPTFLNALYFNTVLGHKQILSTSDVRTLFARSGLETLEVHKLHELSMPHEAYLKRLLRSDRLARSLAPAARTIFRVLPIRNKMLALGARLTTDSLENRTQSVRCSGRVH
jgi:2-polyprenyl-3-methyl-5-hydroxy-6-metoxy-1,4-benzoquinol methylase